MTPYHQSACILAVATPYHIDDVLDMNGFAICGFIALAASRMHMIAELQDQEVRIAWTRCQVLKKNLLTWSSSVMAKSPVSDDCRQDPQPVLGRQHP